MTLSFDNLFFQMSSSDTESYESVDEKEVEYCTSVDNRLHILTADQIANLDPFR